MKLKEKYLLVKEFMIEFGQPTPLSLCLPPREIRELRFKLIREEFSEFLLANNEVDKLDGLIDTEYVLIGALLDYGINPCEIDPKKIIYPQRNFKYLDASNRDLMDCTNPDFVLSVLEDMFISLYSEMKKEEYKGIKLFGAFKEVHRSNMTKFWTPSELILIPSGCKYYKVENGNYRVHDKNGKVIKSPSFNKPQLKQFICKKN